MTDEQLKPLQVYLSPRINGGKHSWRVYMEPLGNDSIHVIEYSAYQALQKERDALVVAHDTQVHIAKELQKLVIEVKPEMEKYEEKLRVAVEALSEIREKGARHASETATTALQEKLRELREFVAQEHRELSVIRGLTDHGQGQLAAWTRMIQKIGAGDEEA